jgi:DNA-binding LacI/PurR family transcriptional regulator
MREVFDRALRSRGATAWVGLSDTCALAAQHYLQAQRVRVPEEISLVGFDNGTEAFCNGLTSYDFNPPGAVEAMLGHVMQFQGARARRGQSQGMVEVPGTIMVRGTTAPVRSAA